MDPIGTAAVALGTQVVKTACRLWLGAGFAGDMAETVSDLLADRVTDAIEHRRLVATFEEFALSVADGDVRAAITVAIWTSALPICLFGLYICFRSAFGRM